MNYLIVPLSAGLTSEYSENWYVVAKHLIQPAPYYLSHFSALAGGIVEVARGFSELHASRYVASAPRPTRVLDRVDASFK